MSFSTFYTSLFASILFLSSFPLIAKQENTITIEHSWIRQAPPNSKVLAAYLELHNHTDKDRSLIKISSKFFEKIEIHNSINHDGMAQMEQKQHVVIPALQKVVFQPNGLHLMLIKPTKGLIAGDHVTLKFTFDNNSTMNTDVAVKKRPTDTNSTHHHQK